MHSNHDKLLKSKTQIEIVTNLSPEKHMICIIQALGLLCNFSRHAQECSLLKEYCRMCNFIVFSLCRHRCAETV